MPEQIDPRKLLRGYDGALYHDGQMLLAVNEFAASLTVTNSDYQPAKSKLVVGVLTGYSCGLTFTEAIVKDATLLVKLFDHVKGGLNVDFDFMGELEGHDGTYSRQVFRACEPDGTIDLMNVTQGDLLRRGWSFRVNEIPDLQDVLGAAS